MKTYPLPALLHLWWHCENSVGAMETCRTTPQERRHRITMAMPLLERMESRTLKRDVHIHIPHSRENVEATHIPTDPCMHGQSELGTPSGVLYGLKKAGNSDTDSHMHGPWRHHAK